MEASHTTEYTVKLNNAEAAAVVEEVNDIFNVFVKTNADPDGMRHLLQLKDTLVQEMR